MCSIMFNVAALFTFNHSALSFRLALELQTTVCLTFKQRYKINKQPKMAHLSVISGDFNVRKK